MATISIRAPSVSAAPRKTRRRIRARLPAALALLPTALVVLVVYIGCMLWTVRLSFTSSTLLPKLDWVGLAQYSRLFANDRFIISAENIVIFGVLFVSGCLVLGFLLAVFIDQNVRGEGRLPHRSSSTRTRCPSSSPAWPGNGSSTRRSACRSSCATWAFTSFTFDWLVNQDMAIYTIVIAGLWHGSGLAMAILLAGLRGVDEELWKAATRRRHPDLARLYLDRPAAAPAR